MDEDRDAPGGAAARTVAKPAKSDREARLAAALRSNLRRRKAAGPSTVSAPGPAKDRRGEG